VVSANAQFATVRFLSSPFFLFGHFVTHAGRTGGPILTIYMSYDILLPNDVPFGGFVDMPAHVCMYVYMRQHANVCHRAKFRGDRSNLC